MNIWWSAPRSTTAREVLLNTNGASPQPCPSPLSQETPETATSTPWADHTSGRIQPSPTIADTKPLRNRLICCLLCSMLAKWNGRLGHRHSRETLGVLGEWSPRHSLVGHKRRGRAGTRRVTNGDLRDPYPRPTYLVLSGTAPSISSAKYDAKMDSPSRWPALRRGGRLLGTPRLPGFTRYSAGCRRWRGRQQCWCRRTSSWLRQERRLDHRSWMPQPLWWTQTELAGSS